MEDKEYMVSEEVEPPQIIKPRLDQFHADDKLLSEFIVRFDTILLNVDEHTFYRPSTGNKLSYKEFCKLLNNKFLPLEVVEMMSDHLISLRERFDFIRDEFKKVFGRWTLNLEEKTNYILELEKYSNNLWNAYQDVNSKLQIRLDNEHVESLRPDFEKAKYDFEKAMEKTTSASRQFDDMKKEILELKKSIETLKSDKTKTVKTEVNGDALLD